MTFREAMHRRDVVERDDTATGRVRGHEKLKESFAGFVAHDLALGHTFRQRPLHQGTQRRDFRRVRSQERRTERLT